MLKLYPSERIGRQNRTSWGSMIWQLSINRSRNFLSFLAAFVQVIVLYSIRNLRVSGYSEEEMYNAKEFDPF